MNINFLKNDFLEEIKIIFGEDYKVFLNSYSEKPFRGISINTLKTTQEKIQALLPFKLKKTPFYINGYYINNEINGLGNNPLHHAGAFYVQEPSASAPVSLLDVNEGEKILDLCAAPGGKSSQIATLLNHSGLLWSNEIVKSRSQILLSNLERMGTRAFVVSNCSPNILCKRLSGFFDKVLVDAPCSGEGMFRKNHEAASEWSREHVKASSERQLSILESAAEAVRYGGIIVYSTCTFSFEENEGVINKFLQLHNEFSIDKFTPTFGRKGTINNGIRISPLEGGEGQFMVRLVKKGDASNSKYKYKHRKNTDDAKLIDTFFSEIFKFIPMGNIEVINNRAYLFPDEIPEFSGLGVIRAGVLIGEIKKNRIEPAHALFSAFNPEYFNNVLNLNIFDERIKKFLKGEEIECNSQKGYTLFSIENISTGFGKCSNGYLKNKYPKGLRQK